MNNSRLLCGIGILIFLLSCAQALASPFSDVPKQHWAYNSVADLMDRGILTGYPDNSFRGNKTLTRYEMAMVISRLISRADELKIRGKSLSSSDYVTIEKLTLEFADELALLGVKVSSIEDDVAVVKDDVAVVKDELALVKKAQPSKLNVSGELLSYYMEGHYDSKAGSLIQSPDDAPFEHIMQMLKIFVDTHIDDDVALHLGFEYGWNAWGGGGAGATNVWGGGPTDADGISGNFATGLTISEAYIHADDFFGWADAIRAGRQEMSLAQDLLFNPTSLDGIFMTRNMNHNVEFIGFGAVRNTVDEDLGLNLFALSAKVDLKDAIFQIYYAAKNDHNDLHIPAGSGINNLGSIVGTEYLENGEFELNSGSYTANYAGNWKKPTGTRYVGIGVNGLMVRDLAYYAEIATMDWNKKVLNPENPDGSGTLGVQTGINSGLKWTASDNVSVHLNYRYHSKYFEPIVATKGVFSNNLDTAAGFGEIWPTCWEILGYTRDFSDILARVEYSINDKSSVWASVESITDNRKTQANEVKDDMTIAALGMKYLYKNNTVIQFSYFSFDGQDANNGAFIDNNVGATNKTNALLDQNLHIGNLSGVQEDQSIFRLDIQVRF